MTIAYYSMTGNIERFLSGTGVAKNHELFEINEDTKAYDLNRPFVLVTPTYGFGEVPTMVKQFLHTNGKNLVAVASSGNRNWGPNFAKSGEHISSEYFVPLILKFELHGSNDEREQFVEALEGIGDIYEDSRRETV